MCWWLVLWSAWMFVWVCVSVCLSASVRAHCYQTHSGPLMQNERSEFYTLRVIILRKNTRQHTLLHSEHNRAKTASASTAPLSRSLPLSITHLHPLFPVLRSLSLCLPPHPPLFHYFLFISWLNIHWSLIQALILDLKGWWGHALHLVISLCHFIPWFSQPLTSELPTPTALKTHIYTLNLLFIAHNPPTNALSLSLFSYFICATAV